MTDAMTKIAAHRGGWGCAENSVQAMENAITIGADMVEFDVRATADAELILCHAPTLRARPIDRMTLAEVRDLLGAAAPPLLDEVVQRCADRILMDVEIKEGGHEAHTLDVLRRHCAADQYVVTSFLDSVIADVKRLDPSVRCGLLLRGTHLSDVSPWRRVARCGADFIAPHFSLARSGLWRGARRRGMPIAVWTVNGERAIRRSLNQGLELLITDTPAIALSIRDQPNAGRRRRSGRAA